MLFKGGDASGTFTNASLQLHIFFFFFFFFFIIIIIIIKD
jgi:hypothetical protein